MLNGMLSEWEAILLNLGQSFTHIYVLEQQWKMDHLEMHFLLKMGILHCYISLPEGIWPGKNYQSWLITGLSKKHTEAARGGRKHTYIS